MMEVRIDRPGVLALSFSGHLSHHDLSACFDRLEQALASEGKLHLYVEVTALSGLDSETLMNDLGRGLRLMGRLQRFGRVAIVSDQDWVRCLSRVESALLPGVSYKIYRSRERDQALSWVEGREALPYGHVLRIMETDRPDVVGVEIDGRLSAEEVAEVARELNNMRGEHRVSALLLRVKSLGGFDPAIILGGEYLRMKLGFLRELDHYAVIGGPDWLRDGINYLRPYLKIELRHFEPSAETQAWTWLGAKPVLERPLAA